MNKKGFTMIELLVVISIIGILAALALVSFTSSQKQARDTKRKSDIKQYQNLLEGFANKTNGTFPSRITSIDVSNLCGTLGISGTCPTDPKAPDLDYRYVSNGSGGVATDATEYVLWASLEGQSQYYWVLCSNGKVGLSLSAPQSSSCPI
jgi:prepilin-type N-terminal cleavage/methylation domain-containing protein